MALVFSNSALLWRKSAFTTDIPLPVKTIGSSRDVRGGTRVLRNTNSLEDLVRRLVQVAAVRRMFSQKKVAQTCLTYMTVIGIIQNY